MRLDGYIRDLPVGSRSVTVDSQIIPAERQRQAIESYAAELGGEVCAWHHDAQDLVDKGGGVLDDGTRTHSVPDWPGADDGAVTFGSQARPGLQRALKRLGEGKTDGIVVMSLDRIAATSEEAHGISRSIIDAGRVFASCRERLDPRTPEDVYARIFMQMPPPHSRDVLAILSRSNRGEDGGPATLRHRYPAPPRSRRKVSWRDLVSVFAVPLAALGINRYAEKPQPTPTVVQRVEISISAAGSTEPPPGSDWKAVSTLLEDLSQPPATNSGKRKRVVPSQDLADAIREYDYRLNGSADPSGD